MDKKYWIDVAWGDIEASEVLYENGNYLILIKQKELKEAAQNG